MKKIVLSLSLILAFGFLFEEAICANNGSVNSIVYNNTNEIIGVSNLNRYRFLGMFRMGPYAASASIHVYTDGNYYYCSDFPQNKLKNVVKRNLEKADVSIRYTKIAKDIGTMIIMEKSLIFIIRKHIE